MTRKHQKIGQQHLRVVDDTQETAQERRARWQAGLEARARDNAEYNGIEYEVALLEETVHANKCIIDYLETYEPFVKAVMAIPTYFFSDDDEIACEEKITLIQKVVTFLPDGLLAFLSEDKQA